MNAAQLDFGYTWPWTHGQLVLAALLGALALLVWARTRSPWGAGFLGACAAWMLVGFLIVHHAFAVNAPLPPPPSAFLRTPGGRVLDLGCGSGRAALMVLSSRPGTTVVALDEFSGGVPDLEEGHVLSITYVPGKGTTVKGTGASEVTVPAKDFADALLLVWLGTNPLGDDLKGRLLGAK